MKENNTSNLLNQKNVAFNLLNKSKRIIRFLALLTASIFTWLNLKGLPLSSIANDLSTDLILKISLILYYLAWVYGATLDASDSSVVIQKVKNKGKIPLLGLVISTVTCILFIGLCYYFTSPKLSFFIFIFWNYNFFAWKLLNKEVVKPNLDLNRRFYESQKDFLMFKRFKLVENFVYDKWNFWRFIFGLIYLLILIFYSQTNVLDFFFPNIENKRFIISICILLFVFITELWIWYFRLKKSFGIKTITEILHEKMKSE